jgi:hypothetical protein
MKMKIKTLECTKVMLRGKYTVGIIYINVNNPVHKNEYQECKTGSV